MTEPQLLNAAGVGRRYAGRVVLEDFSLQLGQGDVVGLLGVNGAGKSTALRLLAGVLAPDAGSIRVAGADLIDTPRRAATLVGYLPEQPPLYRELTVTEFLRFCARLRGLGGATRAAIARAIERCDLGDIAHRLIAVLSRGQQQRVGLAQAILHQPPLLLLDEPTNGLDPVQAARLRELILELKPEHGIVLSTHQLPEVAAMCNRVAMLHQGRIRLAGAVADLAAGGETLEQRFLRIALALEPAA